MTTKQWFLGIVLLLTGCVESPTPYGMYTDPITSCQFMTYRDRYGRVSLTPLYETNAEGKQQCIKVERQ